MKTVFSLLRILAGLFVGFIGCIALLNAPYQLLNANFKIGNGGPLVAASLILGSLLVWGAWRLIRGPSTRQTAAFETARRLNC